MKFQIEQDTARGPVFKKCRHEDCGTTIYSKVDVEKKGAGFGNKVSAVCEHGHLNLFRFLNPFKVIKLR